MLHFKSDGRYYFWTRQLALNISKNCLPKYFLIFLRFGVYYLMWLLRVFCICRLFGVTSLTQTNCSNTWMIIKNQELHWYHHANPILLLVMYYTLATLIRLWLQEPIVRVTSFSLLMINDWETGQGRYLLTEVQKFRKIQRNRQQVQDGTLNLFHQVSPRVWSNVDIILKIIGTIM